MSEYKYKVISVRHFLHDTIPSEASRKFKMNQIVHFSDLLDFASEHAFILEGYQGGVWKIYDMKGDVHVEATVSTLDKGYVN